jgi:hypothetical protein
MKALMQNFGGISDRLKQGPYAEPALVPASPWLGKEMPGKPADVVDVGQEQIKVTLDLASGDKRPWQWLVRERWPSGWKTTILPGAEQTYVLKANGGQEPSAVVVSAISRLGLEGESTQITMDGRK